MLDSGGGTPSERSAQPFGVGPVEVRGPEVPRTGEVLSSDVLSFLGSLHERFEPMRRELLGARGWFREALRRGDVPTFPSETQEVRTAEWKVAPCPEDLADRRVEITGPPERKMIINALNSGARVYMADFEDAHAPTWKGTITGQANLIDAVRKTIAYTSPEGREYHLSDQVARLMVRPRGWHLPESHVLVEDRPISASLFDFGVYLHHNANELRRRGSGPYFYLPKLEHYLEARLWNDVFCYSEERLGLPPGTIRATVLIETVPAAFQMDEILWELRTHSVGLNCGRWDYLFSLIKQYRDVPGVLFPDRDQLTMSTAFLTAYSRRLVQVCHRRGAHAIGGMAAQIPIKGNAAANEDALAKVRADKEREVRNGHDGTWVAHPGLVPVALSVFNEHMPDANRIGTALPPENITPAELLAIPPGDITLAGVHRNAKAALRYTASWLGGNGCVPIENLMEDAATAEIARTQLWQWVHHGARVREGPPVDLGLIGEVLLEEVSRYLSEADHAGEAPVVEAASRILLESVARDELDEFLTLLAYPELEEPGSYIR